MYVMAVYFSFSIYFINFYKMKTKERRLKEALDLFQYGYENSVVAARCEISIEEVKELRRKYRQ